MASHSTYPLACPECLGVGRMRLVSRSQLVALASDAGVELHFWPASSGSAYWWCDRCSNGGAIFGWSRSKRGA